MFRISTTSREKRKHGSIKAIGQTDPSHADHGQTLNNALLTAAVEADIYDVDPDETVIQNISNSTPHYATSIPKFTTQAVSLQHDAYAATNNELLSGRPRLEVTDHGAHA